MPRSMSDTSGTAINPTFKGVTSDHSVRSSKTAGAASITATGAVALTVAQLRAKVIKIDPGGAGRALTFPSAAQLIAGGLGLDNDDDLAGPFLVANTADAAEDLTPGVSTGVVLNNAAAFGQNASAFFWLYRVSSSAVIAVQK